MRHFLPTSLPPNSDTVTESPLLVPGSPMYQCSHVSLRNVMQMLHDPLVLQNASWRLRSFCPLRLPQTAFLVSILCLKLHCAVIDINTKFSPQPTSSVCPTLQIPHLTCSYSAKCTPVACSRIARVLFVSNLFRTFYPSTSVADAHFNLFLRVARIHGLYYRFVNDSLTRNLEIPRRIVFL